MNYRSILIFGTLALSMAACTQQSTPKSNVVGTLEVTFSSNPSENKAVLRPLASTPVADTAITVNTITTSFGTNGTFNYVRALVGLTANQAFNNLTFYAYNKTGNVGGTAVKNLVNFAGGSAADAANAQSLLPVHSRDASGAYIADTQDFQAFSSSDLTPVQAFVPGETVLQYGFVARKNTTTRAFAAADTGTINLAYKIPVATGTNTYKFTATFVVADETVSRVTRDIDETAAQADARAAALVPAATEVMLIGVDTQGTATRSGGKRFSNIKIGTSINLLPDPALAVVKVGDGAAALSGAAFPVAIERLMTNGTLQTPISLPSTGAGRKLVESGTSTSAGGMTLSENGKCLAISGYDAVSGTAGITATTSATANRVVALVDSTGAIDLTTALTDGYSGNNIRGATSTNCSDIWTSGTGTNPGSRFTTKGMVGTSTQLSTTVTNLRFSGVFAGQLYTSSGSGAFRVATVGTGTPTTTGQTITNIVTGPTSPYGFFFADLDATIAGVDTLYVADDGGTANIAKYSLVGGNWTANGSITLASTRGLTGIVDGNTVQLFVTNGTTLQSLTDTTGYNATLTGTPTLLATAATNTAFRGVALQPR